MEVGVVQTVDIDQEMQQAYLDYAMSVIVARALPDARDGLKPVHRRILYAMHDMGLRPETSFKKSARIVGEVLGKYHPHSDMAVYDAMARMAQDFSMRYLLVDGQGNFGSVDGDPPAAMRYTEARLTQAAVTLLTDIQKNTVDFADNFDGTLNEPTVLPASLPNMLVNGATGIAVGMATNIPPHNLAEVVDALQFLLEKWEKLDDVTLDDLMQFIQGPDFPTGGVIIHDSEKEDEGLRSAYGTGRGKITLQAKAHMEEMERGRNRIIVTQLPFMTNKASLIEKIAQLARDEKIEGISDLRDESDRQGMRIVIELSKTVTPDEILRDLFRLTPMQGTFSIILLALVDGEPRLLNLKNALRVFIEHRLEIVRRRAVFDLERAKARAHILEGLRIALENLDEVINLIRRSPDVETARTRLIRKFKLSEIQAQAILDMPLRRLAALERKKIEDEYKQLLAFIKELNALLRSPKKMREVVSQELQEIKGTFGDRRRTQIISLMPGTTKSSVLTARDLLPEKSIWIGLTQDGFIYRTPDEKQPRISGKSAPVRLVKASTRDTLFLVEKSGEAAALAVHSIPEQGLDQDQDGVPFWRVSPFNDSHRISGVFSLPEKERPEDKFILTVSRMGMVKKSPLSELPGPSAGTFILARVNEDDEILDLHITDGTQEVLLATSNGMTIRFNEDEVRPMGLVAAGVMGVKLQIRDEIVGSDYISSKPDPKRAEVLLVASNGTAKRVAVKDFPRQGRYGQGVIAWKMSGTAKIAGVTVGKSTDRVTLHFNRLAAKPMRFDEAPLRSRAAQGKVVQELKEGDLIIAVSAPRESGIESSERTPPTKPPRSRKTMTTPAATAQKSTSRTRSTSKGKQTKSSSAGVKKTNQPKSTSTRKTKTTSSGSSPAKPSTSGSSSTSTSPGRETKTKPTVKRTSSKSGTKTSETKNGITQTPRRSPRNNQISMFSENDD